MTEPRRELGEDCVIDDPDSVGYLHDESADPAVIGDRARIRKGTIVYADVEIGDDFTTGHNALVREDTTIGDSVIVGTDTVIDGTTEIGSHVSLQTGVYVPTDTTIGSNVFVGPRAVMTNDHYPVRQDEPLEGPTIEDGVSVGANATILPGVRVGAGSFVAAGATVTEDVPPHTLALGTPARHRDLPDSLTGENLLNE
ncbi:acyltransferase [Halalkalicoccus tibetensis]|uniref:Acyltransferase n=1 Tax=Halalkalicoccus tibetensis TaxID=175632 RepID=A0ABD5V620_9EURY